jgi:hypothetical protein
LAAVAITLVAVPATSCLLVAQAPGKAQKSTPAQNAPTPTVGEARPLDSSTAAGARELDRVVAIVNGDLVLDSDVDEERRFAAFEPYSDNKADFSRDKAIDRLINRDLILQQIKLQPEDQISDADVTKQINSLRKAIPACREAHCETQQGWDRFLAEHGFTEAALFARWKQRVEMLQFIEERFRLGIQITPEQIKSYYEQTLLPAYAGRHAEPPQLDAISAQIQEVLLQQQMTDLLNDWLKSLRAQGNIEVLHPGEEAP